MMKKTDAIKIFIEHYYPNNLYQELRKDRLAVQFNWECFVDYLCKNGDITQEQFNNWTFPWGY